MSEVKRVDFFAYLDDEVAELDYNEANDGAWVAADDYDQLAAELATVKKVAYGNLELMEERDKLAADNKRLENLSVERIMLDVVPGPDGMGAEVYAKSVADVENKLSAMGDRIEFMEDQRTRYTAENQRLREALETAKYRIEQGRVWNGMGWTLTGLHPHGQQMALDAIDAALSTTANGEGAE